MLNYKSVRSSAPQIRSNPALRHVSDKSGFQKRLATLLEPTPLPFPTFQIVKEPSKPALEQHPYYAWVRPAHLRAQWIVVADGLPLLLVDPRDQSKVWSLRIPFDISRVQHTGPFVLEGAWDAQDHILWIWDAVVWEKQTVWSSKPYSQRWELVKTAVSEILDCGHPMSDAEVRVPSWESLATLKTRVDLDPAMSIEFQPEKAGQRRLLFLIRDEGVKFKPTSYAERKMVAEITIHPPPGKKHERKSEPTSNPTNKHQTIPCQIQMEMEAENQVHTHQNQVQPQPQVQTKQKQPFEEKKVNLRKDVYTNLPDTYRIVDTDGNDLGLAAVRSLGMSKELRELFKTTEHVSATVRWYEPFQKYEVRHIDM